MSEHDLNEGQSLWGDLRRRAAALHHRYGNIPGGPEDTRSLMNRASAKFPHGGLPVATERDHLLALWTKALCSVLNDARRRPQTAFKHGYQVRVPLDEHHLQIDERDGEVLRQMIRALQRLAQLDEVTNEHKAEILTLRYLDGLTWREVAERLGSSITTVRREAQFAAAWMRDQLARSGVKLDDMR